MSTGPAGEPGPDPVRRRRWGAGITTRALALVVVLLILTISYANSLRIFFDQEQQIATAKAQIAERQQRINDLQTRLGQWNDPDFVRQQARERLGWVVPGETGYKVVDEDGQPLGGGAEVSAAKAPPVAEQPAWYAKLWGSVEAADAPVPVATKPKKVKPLTADSSPAPEPTESAGPTESATPR